MSDLHELAPVGRQETLGHYLSEMWQRRAFAINVPRHDMRSQNMDTSLGQLWHIVNPALLVAVYFLIFGVLLKANRGVDNYLGFLVVGVVIFQLTQRVAQEGATAIFKNEGLIRSIQFPRALLPISTVHAQTFAFFPSLLVVAATLFLTGEVPTWKWLVFPVVILAQYGVNIGMAFYAGRAGNALRDLPQILPHLFRLLFYLSGVIFSIQRFVHNPAWRRVFLLNPIFLLVTASRWCLLGEPMGPSHLVALLFWTIVLPITGFLWFRRAEHRYGA